MKRLFLAAYDVRSPSRLRRVLRNVRGFASGGQYSAYECWLNDASVRELIEEQSRIIDSNEDSFALIPIAARPQVQVLGMAVEPASPSLLWLD